MLVISCSLSLYKSYETLFRNSSSHLRPPIQEAAAAHIAPEIASIVNLQFLTSRWLRAPSGQAPPPHPPADDLTERTRKKGDSWHVQIFKNQLDTGAQNEEYVSFLGCSIVANGGRFTNKFCKLKISKFSHLFFQIYRFADLRFADPVIFNRHKNSGNAQFFSPYKYTVNL
jgi:hypothetical protein